MHVDLPKTIGTPRRPTGAGSLRPPIWLLSGLWVILGALLLSLLGVTVYLLVRMDFFSDRPLTDVQLKSLWAFLGVALGAVVTLIGTLLTEQHNRRTAALASEAAQREQIARETQEALAKQAEQRLTVDTVAKTLELITEDGKYAQKARVSGAIATMLELEGGAVAVRVLGNLWEADAVSTETAMWLIKRVLREHTDEDEIIAAASLLAVNASKLIPKRDDPQQDWENWRSIMVDSWPIALPEDARNALLVGSLKLLLSRELDYWTEIGDTPVRFLVLALQDERFCARAAQALVTLLDLGVLDRLGSRPDSTAEEELRSLPETRPSAPWYTRLLVQFDRWARGEHVAPSREGADIPITPTRQQGVVGSNDRTS